MRPIVLPSLLLGTTLALAGCTTAPQTRVTTFNLGQPIARGQIAVEPRDGAMGASLEYESYAGAVMAELGRIGFTPAAGVAQSEFVATMAVNRDTREGLARSSPFSVGLGGGTFSGGRRGGGVGLGGGVSFPIGKKRSNAVVATELAVQIKRRSDGTVIWEGRAQTDAREGSAAAAPVATVQRLAAGLFRDFPGVSGRTVVVK